MKKRSKNGFALMELLVVVSLFGVISVLGSSLFFNIIRSSSKTRVLTEVKQNGDFAMTTMVRMIRNARKISAGSCGWATNSLEIKNPDGGITTFEFCSPENLIASRSGSLPLLSCTDARLTSDRVKVVSGSFTCEEGDRLKPDMVTIRFSLSQVGSANPLITPRPEEQAVIDFETKVALRNY